jgi:hypothetical protein
MGVTAVGKLLAWRGLASVRVLAAGLTFVAEEPVVLAWDELGDDKALPADKSTGSAVVVLVTE